MDCPPMYLQMDVAPTAYLFLLDVLIDDIKTFSKCDFSSMATILQDFRFLNLMLMNCNNNAAPEKMDVDVYPTRFYATTMAKGRI